MTEYFKIRNKPRHIEIVEISDGKWLSITKRLNIVGIPLFEVYKVDHNPDDYPEQPWRDGFKIDKSEFDQLKTEFLNWINQNID